jgi:hypothetical protein
MQQQVASTNFTGIGRLPMPGAIDMGTASAATPWAGYLPAEGAGGLEDAEGLLTRAHLWEETRDAASVDAKEVALLGGKLLERYEARLPDGWEDRSSSSSSHGAALEALRVDPYSALLGDILRTAGGKHGVASRSNPAGAEGGGGGAGSGGGEEPACESHESLRRWRRYAVKAEEAAAAARAGAHRGPVALRDGPGVVAAADALLLLQCEPLSSLRVSRLPQCRRRAAEHRHPTGRERMGSPTLQPRPNPILLTWVRFRGRVCGERAFTPLRCIAAPVVCPEGGAHGFAVLPSPPSHPASPLSSRRGGRADTQCVGAARAPWRPRRHHPRHHPERRGGVRREPRRRRGRGAAGDGRDGRGAHRRSPRRDATAAAGAAHARGAAARAGDVPAGPKPFTPRPTHRPVPCAY